MGQATKNRIVCPVTKQPIQPDECGATRISVYPCPELCPQNPWSADNYDRQLDISGRMNKRCLSRLKKEYRHTGRFWTLPSMEPGNEILLMLFFFNRFFRDRDGTNFFRTLEGRKF